MEKEFTLTLTEKDLQVVSAGLSEVKLGAALATFTKIQYQVAQQNQQAAVASGQPVSDQSANS